MSERCTEFDEKGCYSYKKISAVTIPILLSMLMEHIIGMTDTIFLGRVSEVALGARIGLFSCLFCSGDRVQFRGADPDCTSERGEEFS